MNMQREADNIYAMNGINIEEKIKLLQELIIDCQNEMDAQDQNMRSEVQHRLSEGLRVAHNYLRELKSRN